MAVYINACSRCSSPSKTLDLKCRFSRYKVKLAKKRFLHFDPITAFMSFMYLLNLSPMKRVHLKDNFFLVWIQSLPCPRLVALSRQPSLSYYLLITGGRRDGFISFLRALARSETPKALSMTWIRFTKSISDNNNRYAKRLSLFVFIRLH